MSLPTSAAIASPTPGGLPAWLARTVTPEEQESWEERQAIVEESLGGPSFRAKSDQVATDCLLAARKRRAMGGGA